MGSEETYSTSETAKVSRISTRRVTQLLERGELEGANVERGRWRVDRRMVHAMLSATINLLGQAAGCALAISVARFAKAAG
jgi:hypothetical protein